MKKLLIFILAFAAASLSKEIEIDVDKMTDISMSNEVHVLNGIAFCESYNDTVKTASKCSIEHHKDRKVKIKITEYKCPHLLPSPLAVYHKAGETNTLEFHAWAKSCGKLQHFSLHYVENGIEFLKHREVKDEKITFKKVVK